MSGPISHTASYDDLGYALRSRECAVAFHFHIEVSSQIIYDWDGR